MISDESWDFFYLFYLYHKIFTCTPEYLWVRDTKHILILGVGGKIAQHVHHSTQIRLVLIGIERHDIRT